MIGLDTNILVRYLAADDPVQSPQALDLIRGCLQRGEELYISTVTLVETTWTLRSRYHVPLAVVCEKIATLASTAGVRLADSEAVDVAIGLTRTTGCDFPDALIAELGRRAGCTRTATFDAAAARKLDAMRLVSEA